MSPNIKIPQLLDLLCAWTTSEDGSEIRAAVQSDTSLLIDAVYLLRMVHELGSKVDAFRPVRKLSELDESAVAGNPVFGFKRDLVRLIGNMCWRNKKNQDMVRGQNFFNVYNADPIMDIMDILQWRSCHGLMNQKIFSIRVLIIE